MATSGTAPGRGRKPGKRGGISLRAALAVVLVAALGLGYLAGRARTQREAVRWIEQSGGSVIFEHQVVEGTVDPEATLPGPSWLKGHVDDDYLRDPAHVTLIGPEVGDDQMRRLSALSGIRGLNVAFADLGPEGFRALRRFEHLKSLRVSVTELDDDGLEHLSGLTGLETLDLTGTNIGDAGLARLSRLDGLKRLELAYTDVGDEGVAHLTGLDRLEWLNLHGTLVTDAGLEHLKGLTSLTMVELQWTGVSPEAIEELRQALPNAVVLE